MRYRTLTAALAAIALVFSPMPSFAQTAPQPAVSQESGLQLADEYGSERPRKKRRLLLWLILGGIAAAVIAYCLVNGGGDDEPTSP
jgi:hypothetical protein